MNQLKLITLDLDNTLWETDPVIEIAERLSYEALVSLAPGVSDLYSITGLRHYKAELAECYPSLAHQISTLRYETLRRTALQAGCDHDSAARIAQQAFDVFYEERSKLTLFEGARDALTHLSSQYPLIALTNGNANLAAVGIDHLFSAYFNAESVGAAKPEPDLFHAALEHQGVRAEDCLHIGDHPVQDIHAARTLGFQTLWVNALNLDWPNDVPPPPYRIHHLSELVPAVKAFE